MFNFLDFLDIPKDQQHPIAWSEFEVTPQDKLSPEDWQAIIDFAYLLAGSLAFLSFML